MKTQQQSQKVEAIRKAIRELSGQEFLVETNEGTFGQAEAARKVGTAEPRFCNYRVYETVGGVRRHVGCDKDRAPGSARYLRPDGLAIARGQLADLKRQLAEVL